MRILRILSILAATAFGVAWTLPANAAVLDTFTADFIYDDDDVDGDLWGTMTLTLNDDNTVLIEYTALQPDAEGDVYYEVTGFGFEFTDAFDVANFDVINDDGSTWDWYSLDPTVGAKPNPTNGIGGSIKTTDNKFVDVKASCDNNNWNPCSPSFEIGDSDSFLLVFDDLSGYTEVEQIFSFAFVRMQSVALCTEWDNTTCTNWDENAINEGSLFLGARIPLPPAIWLLGSAMLVLVGVGRRRAG